MEVLLTHHGAVAFGTMREIHRHMDPEEAERYLMGGSPEDETAALEEHLLVCSNCRDRVSETDIYLSSMSEAAEEVRAHPGERKWRLSHLLVGLAASALIFILGLVASSRPSVEVPLVESLPATAPAGRGLHLRLDRGGRNLELVNAAGQTAWRGQLAATGDGATIPAQPRGAYLVLLRSHSGELQRKYRLEIR